MGVEVEIFRLIHGYHLETGKALTVATAESATGGRIADRITDVPGISSHFCGSVIAYSNEVKSQVLGVSQRTLDMYGAVSSQAAREMAEGGRKVLGTSMCLSTTGIAGPGGATPGKPVGLFYVALATGDGTLVEEHRFTGSRDENKESAVAAALELLRRYLVSLG